MYTTLTYLNLLRNCKLLKLEAQEKCQNYGDLSSKMHFFQTLFLDLEL